MHRILEKYRNPDFLCSHAQAKELDAQHASNVCTVIVPGMDYIWRYGPANIQMPASVGIKHNIDN